MSRRLAWRVLAGAVFMGAQVGCMRFGHETQPFLPPMVPSEPALQSKNELPPHEAAKACLAAAQEMDKGGFPDKAIAYYEKAREHNPRLNVSRRLAVLYDRQGDQARALAEYEKALDANPKDADLLNDVGYFYYQRHDAVEAEKWFREAVKQNPKHQRAWVNLGLALGRQGRYEESYEAFAKAVTPAEARYNVGAVLANQGAQLMQERNYEEARRKHEEAKQALRQALSLDPNLAKARAVLAVLENPPPEPDPSVFDPKLPPGKRLAAAAHPAGRGMRERTDRRPAAPPPSTSAPPRPLPPEIEAIHDRTMPATKPIIVTPSPAPAHPPAAADPGGVPAIIGFEGYTD
jgi:tetratricopeptide (TPR) repeat protein